jgi:hypothetical protein
LAAQDFPTVRRRFTQLLEGPRESALKLFASIERDFRHRTVSILGIQHSEHRRCADWTMVFAGTADTAKADYRDHIGWSAIKSDNLGALLLNMVRIDVASRPASLDAN